MTGKSYTRTVAKFINQVLANAQSPSRGGSPPLEDFARLIFFRRIRVWGFNSASRRPILRCGRQTQSLRRRLRVPEHDRKMPSRCAGEDFRWVPPLHLNGQRQIKWQGGLKTPCRAAYYCRGSWLFSNSGRGLKFSVNILRRVRNRSMGVAVCLMLRNGRRVLRPSSYSEWSSAIRRWFWVRLQVECRIS